MTIDVIEIPRRRTMSRSSSYSLSSAASSAGGSRDPLDRIRGYSSRSTDSVFPSPNGLAPPVYSPPPNTPTTFEPMSHNYSNNETIPVGLGFGSSEKDNDPFNPFSYSGPTQYPNHTSQAPSQSNGVQDLHLSNPPNNGLFQTSSTGIADLEKARGYRQPDHPQKKRHCARKTVTCWCAIFAIFFVLVAIAIVIVVIKLGRHAHHKHHRRDCVTVPAM